MFFVPHSITKHVGNFISFSSFSFSSSGVYNIIIICKSFFFSQIVYYLAISIPYLTDYLVAFVKISEKC